MVGDTTFGAYESLTRLAVGRDVLNWMSVTEYPKRSTINSLLEYFYEDLLKFELMVVRLADEVELLRVSPTEKTYQAIAVLATNVDLKAFTLVERTFATFISTCKRLLHIFASVLLINNRIGYI